METVSHGKEALRCGWPPGGRDITLSEERNSPRSVGLTSLSNKLRSKCQKLAPHAEQEEVLFPVAWSHH